MRDPFIASLEGMYLEQAVKSLLPLAERYQWLRANLQHINFGGLTTDTCDVGLDYAIDRRLEEK
jgi:hypothetical protein